jgi:hypothetical protein
LFNSNAMRFNVTIADPTPTTPCFDEVMSVVAHGLREFGHQTMDCGGYASDALNLVFGYYIAPEQFTRPSIVYQLEPVDDETIGIGHVPVDLLRNNVVWDYNRRNIEQLRLRGVHALYVPPAYHPSLERVVPVEDEDIDVLFYGSVNQRRADILMALHHAGLKVHLAHDCYGADLDPFIARAKVVLCMHNQSWMRVLESVRVSYLFANRKAVVAEINPEDDSDGLESGLLGVPYDRLVSACLALVYTPSARVRLATAGYDIITARPIASVLPPVLRAKAATAA